MTLQKDHPCRGCTAKVNRAHLYTCPQLEDEVQAEICNWAYARTPERQREWFRVEKTHRDERRKWLAQIDRRRQ